MNVVTLHSRLLRTVLFTMVLLGTGLFVGCANVVAEESEAKFKVRPTGQDTPQAALEKAMMGLLNGDFKSFDDSCYQGTAANKAFFECHKKSKALRSALIAKYGKDAWERYNKIAIDGKTSDLSQMHVEREVAVAALKKEIKFHIEGDLAVCEVPWNGRNQYFFKGSNGAWYVDHGTGTTKFAEAQWIGINIGIDAAMKEITQKDITMTELKKISDKAEMVYFKTLNLDE